MEVILGLVILMFDIIAIMDYVAIVDCDSNKSGGQKALWIILILVLPVVGVVLYYVVGKN